MNESDARRPGKIGLQTEETLNEGVSPPLTGVVNDDQDLGALFAARAEKTPEALDKRILTAARKAVACSANRDPGADGNQSTGWMRSRGWMAVAASVVLVVALMPLMIHSPDSRFTAPASDSEMRLSTAPPLSGAEEPAELQQLTNAPADIDARRSLPIHTDPAAASQAPGVTALRIPTRPVPEEVMAEESGARPFEQVLPTAIRYRQSPKRWLDRIRQLQRKERYEEAQLEYQLFRKQHPDFEPQFRLPERY